jgi:adenylate cyclase
MQRKLTVIFSADVVGYGGLMERDEAGTLARLKRNRSELFDPRVAAHRGRIFKLMGDGVLIEFSSAAEAVSCALEIQQAMDAAEAEIADAARLRYRIGINLGDVIVEGDDIYGEGVNVAARLQTLAPVGGVALSRNVADQVSGKVSAALEDLGLHTFKNNERPVHVFVARAAGEGAPAGSLRKAQAEGAARICVCVLPFANMSGDVAQDYFSDGISEDIITDLSKVSALAVVSRNTSFTFKGKHVDVGQVARQLKVSHVVEGSVRKAGNKVRITAQLIDGKSDEHLWAERWDRNLDDIFALQDEISEAIVAALKVRLLPEEKKAIESRGTGNTEAFQIFLMARNAYVTANMTDLPKAQLVERLARRAIELDPSYARAWALLAMVQRMQAYSEGNSESRGDNGLAAAERALALDAGVVEAHAARAGALIAIRDHEGARAALALALRLDPDSYEANTEAGRLAFREQRYAEAIGAYEKAAAAMETDFSAPAMLMSCYAAVGEEAGLRRAATLTLARTEKLLANDPNNGSALSMGIGALTCLGQVERAKEWTRRALLVDPDNLNMRYNIACAFILDLTDYEAALDLLEPVLAKFGKDRLEHAKSDPDLDGVRQHPRFKAMMAKAEARLARE